MEEYGAPSVIHGGTTMMHRWYVGNWGIQPLVSSMSCMVILSINYCLLSNVLGAEAYVNAYFGSGTGPSLLGRFDCTGTEEKLIGCRHRDIAVIGFICRHSDNVGVRCRGIVLLL